MSRRRLLLVLVLAGLPALVLSCAPRDEPSPTDSTGPDGRPAVRKERPPIPEDLNLRLKYAVENVHARDLPLTSGFWTVFHSILGMGPDTTLLDTKTGKKVNALDHVCSGGHVRGLGFEPMSDGGVDVVLDVGGGVGQGHQDQFIAEMAQWGMTLDHPILVKGRPRRFADFTHHSRMLASTTRTPPQELSWAIIIAAQYYPHREPWTNNFGEKMTLDDMARYEVNQPIDAAACGGTHRLFGLTWAYHLHLQKGGKTEGVWKDVADRIDEFKERAKKYQNPDGSFSTAYLAKKENNPFPQARLGSSGHVLEWLALALSDEELGAEWVQRGAGAVAKMILDHADSPIDGGALYHAVHGLHIYRHRAFGAPGPRGLLVPLPPKK